MTELPRQRPFAGVIFLIAGLWTLSMLDATAKWLAAAGFSVLVISWARYVVHLAIVGTIVLRKRGLDGLRTGHPWYQFLRSLLMVASTILFFTVLRYLPLAEGTSINFCAPLIIIALSPWILGEPARLARWIGVLAGFCGMLLVVRPGSGLDPTGVALGLLTATTFASYQIATRLVARDDPLTTNLYGGLVGSAILSMVLPFVWTDISPTPMQWFLLFSTGVTGALGHMFQITAYRVAPASLLSPFTYMQTVSSTTIGWLVFGHLPDALSGLGILIISAAGIFVVVLEWLKRPPLASIR